MIRTDRSADPGSNYGIYIHVPFCVRKCFYCDFNSYTLDRHAVDAYLQALDREIAWYQRRFDREGFSGPFETVFIGGGTPTCLAGKDLAWLVQRVRNAFPLKEGAEITCEANPGSSNWEKFAAMREAGVNRLSIGAQSMDDDLLAAIGRTHSADDIVESVAAARRAGFDNLNLDLMFALPKQSMDMWQSTIGEVVALAPEHLSCYSLIIEDGTPFGDLHARGELALPGEDAEAEMYLWVIEALKSRGYEHYEISNFALPGRRSVHNQIYWRIGRYLGLGPGAHGYLGNVRYVNARRPEEYAARLEAGAAPIDEETEVPLADEMDDVMIFGLRMLDGVSEEEFRTRFGVTVWDEYGSTITRFLDMGLLENVGGRLRLTPRGLPVANQVFAGFLRVETR